MADRLSLVYSKSHSFPDQYGSVGWELACKAKGRLFNSGSGHMPRLWVQSPVGEFMRVNQSVFLSPINVSLPLFLPPLPYLYEINLKK